MTTTRTAIAEIWRIVDAGRPQLQNAKWVECIASIRNNETGQIRRLTSHEILEDGEEFPSTHNWEDGNYSCDCNRDSFFNRCDGLGIPAPPCSNGRFSVNLENPATGTVFYREF